MGGEYHTQMWIVRTVALGSFNEKKHLEEKTGGIKMAVVSMKQLLECGVHFGHQTRRWNPKMKPYIFTERNGIYIIDLQKTVRGLERAYDFVREVSKQGGNVLFVGTKRQAQDTIHDQAVRSGQFYITQRWLGGLLTNFDTIRSRVARMVEIQQMQADGTINKYPKKEIVQLQKQLEKLEKYLAGIKEMKALPDALFVIDPRRETIAIAEAHKLGIPVVSIVDTNCDPDLIDYPIPGNDDAIRAIELIVGLMADAVIEGRQGVDGRGSETIAADSDDTDEEETEVAVEQPAVPEALDAVIEDEDKMTVKVLEEQKGWKEKN